MKKINLVFITIFSLLFSLQVSAQEKSITGTVTTTADGVPLPGVSVFVEGTNRGTQTDFDGLFTIAVSAGEKLKVSFLGMKDVSVTVGDATAINVSMEEDSQALDEVIVTAMGIKKEAKKLGYSIQTVKGDDLTKVKSVNVANSLSGRATGVQITQNGSGAGGSASITIRGLSSLTPGSNQPLIVVDGVILDNGSLGQGSFSGGLDYGNGLADLNPDDIASVNVLKGGNATALYGYRGANGVVVVTTKTGKSGKMQVEFSSSATLDNVAVGPELQNSYGQGYYDSVNEQLIYDRTRAGSWGPILDGSEQERFDGVGTAPYSANPGDFKDFYRTGSTFINSISVAGASDDISYRLSYTNLNNKPVLDGSSFQRNSVSLNTIASVTSKLKVQAKVAYTKNEAENRPDITDGQANTVRALILKPRNASNADLEANYIKEDGTPNNFGGSTFTMNPYYAVNTKLNEDEKNRYTSLLSATYEITDGLNATAKYSQDQSNSSASIFKDVGAFDNAPSGQLTEITQQSIVTNADLLLSYNKDFNKITFGSVLGASLVKNEAKSTTVVGNNILDSSLFSINNFSDKTASTNLLRSESQSVFGSIQIGYNNYAFLEITGRNDWSSTLPEKNNSFFYPSVGTSFLVDEIFNWKSDKLNSLKFRMSWAQTGNATSPYQTKPVYNVSSAPYNGVSLFYLGNPNLSPGAAEEGAAPGSIVPNEDLVAELSSEYELGFDAKFFNNRLGLDVTYYNKETKDQILAISLPSSTGSEGKYVNAGLVSNKGWEVALTATPVIKGDFKWDLGVNFTKNENKVEKLVDGLPSTSIASHFNGTINLVATEGNLYGDLVGTTFERDENGNKKYDTDGLPIIGGQDVIGNINPDFLLGITNSFSYKNFDFNFLIDVKSGGDVFSFTDLTAATNGTDVRTLEGREYYSGGNGIMVPENAVIEGTLDPAVAAKGVDPATYNGRLGNISEEWISDASYVKLRQVALTYNLPQSLVQKWSLSKVSIGYIGRNLAILHKNTKNFDPEVGFNTAIQGIEFYDLPSTSSHGMKLSVSF